MDKINFWASCISFINTLKGGITVAKREQEFLDTEAKKLGFKLMLEEVELQLACDDFSEAIKAVFIDRKSHIEKRLGELG